jgi:group I intron endonuclease
MKSGIYKIKNIITGVVYIGKSKNVIQRKNAHFSALNLNKHNNPHLQNSYNKHGKDNFTFEILEYCNIEDLGLRELYYLSLYKDNYNIIQTIDNRQSFPQEMKDKMKLSRILKGLTKSIYSKNLITNEIQKWDSIKECSKKLNIFRKSIQDVLNNKTYTSKNYTFSYTLNFIDLSNKPVINSIKVNLINTMTGEVKEFKSITDLADYFKTDKSYMTKVLKRNKIYKNKYIIEKVPS